MFGVKTNVSRGQLLPKYGLGISLLKLNISSLILTQFITFPSYLSTISFVIIPKIVQVVSHSRWHTQPLIGCLLRRKIGNEPPFALCMANQHSVVDQFLQSKWTLKNRWINGSSFCANDILKNLSWNMRMSLHRFRK